MRRLRPIDRAILAVVLPVWLAMLGLGLRSAHWQIPQPHVAVVPMGTEGRYPEVVAVRSAAEALREGDRIISVGGHDLRGSGAVDFRVQSYLARGDGRPVAFVAERDGRRVEGRLGFFRTIAQGWLLAGSIVFVLGAVFVILRAPESRAAQAVCHSLLAMAPYYVSFVGTSPGSVRAGLLLRMLGASLALPFAVRMVSRFGDDTDESTTMPRWPWLLVLLGPPAVSADIGGPFPAAVAWAALALLMVGGWSAIWRVGIRRYRATNAAARRQWRILFGYGFVVGAPQVVAGIATMIDVAYGSYLFQALALSALWPIVVVIVVLRQHLFDIDRFLSATATWLLAFLLLAGGVLLVVPRAAVATSELLGVDDGLAQLIVFALLALLIVALAQRLRPLLDRVLLAEQRALEEGIGVLLRDLSSCADMREVLTLLGERLHALVQPESSAVYAHAGAEWIPAFAGGTGPAPSFAERASLVVGLEAHPVPVTAATWRRGRGPTLDESDAATLERFGAEVLLPMRHGRALVAFVSLGAKRSGEGYTSTDLTLLGAVAEKVSAELARFESAELARQSESMVADLREEKDAADRANLAKSTFLATASHDLRQPLHALGLFAGALEEKVDDPEARALVRNIQASTQAMEEMFNSVLDVSRLDAGVLEASVGDVPVGPLLTRLRAELEPLAATRGLALRVAPTTLAVRSDPLLLRRILQNLITNALRYTDHGKVLVGCTRRGPAVRIHVCDTGRGIAPDEQGRIFREYHQANDGARSRGGLGLGLAIVQRLARLLDHRVELRSTPGRGSVFTLTVPRCAADAAAVARPIVVDQVAGLTVMAIDDDPSILDGVRQLLGPWGCTVHTAPSGEAATRIVHGGGGDATPDVILADYELGGGETGPEAIATVRRAVGREIPAILITGDTASARLTEARAAGFLLLAKPLAPMRLRAALAHVAAAAPPKA